MLQNVEVVVINVLIVHSKHKREKSGVLESALKESSGVLMLTLRSFSDSAELLPRNTLSVSSLSVFIQISFRMIQREGPAMCNL